MSNDWSADPALVAEVSQAYEVALETYRRNPLLLREHVGHEESLRTGGYSTRTLQELIQNGADAAAAQSGGRLEIVLSRGTLYCANDGAPFTLSGVRALTHAYLSEKRGDEIGRFGLGFKSTLAISNAPQIFSSSVSFGFGGRRAGSDLRSIAGAGRPVPVLRTPVIMDLALESAADPALDELAAWATTVVRLPNIDSGGLVLLKRQMQQFSPEFLLFTDGVSELVIRSDGEFERRLTKKMTSTGRLEIFDGEDSHARWLISHRMHRPSRVAQSEVGAAVARESVKISVAIPEKQSTMRVGEFWAYFPLSDEVTTASGIFNAPWSLNDDRTTLLENNYNREILVQIADLFAESVLQLSTPDDPARHFDYLTARGRESRGFGDRILTQHIPTAAAGYASVPDARGVLCHPNELRPLNFDVMSKDLSTLGAPDTHQAWQMAKCTAPDAPHFRCFADATRRSRLQRLYVEAVMLESREVAPESIRDLQQQALLARAATRHLGEWLKEWSGGSLIDSANALSIATQLVSPVSRGIAEAVPLIPTTQGQASLSQAGTVFLERVEGIEIDGADFVRPDFLTQPGVRKLLKDRGFRKLDAAAILRARIDQLSETPSGSDWEAVWDAAIDLPQDESLRIMKSGSRWIEVPTLDGGWEEPGLVFDVPHDLGTEIASRCLDRRRCIPEIAHKLGVSRSITGRAYPFSSEPCGEEYGQWVIDYLNGRKHPDQAALNSVEYQPVPEVGPASILLLLARSEGPESLRVEWTDALLAQEFSEFWDVENAEGGEMYTAPSFQRWALEEAGLSHSTLGVVSLRRVLSPKLFQYGQVFPVAPRAPRSYSLPDAAEKIPADLLADFLETPTGAESLNDSVLSDLVGTAIRSGAHERFRLPARVGRAVEVHPTSGITLTQNDEEREFARERMQPYLHVDSEERMALFEELGCVPFADGFSFSIECSGRGAEDAVLDMFSGLRGRGFEQKLRDVRVVRVETLTKRVETQQGILDEDHAAVIDGNVLYVRNELSEVEVLGHLNDLLGLGLTAEERRSAQQATLNNQLQVLLAQARSARSDTERLNLLFGPDDLREVLPSGLWDSLMSDGSVTAFTDVAELVLQVYGFETLKLLKAKFERLGFRDVPAKWSGRRTTMDWVRKFGFDERFAGEMIPSLEDVLVVPGAVDLNQMHDYQAKISERLASVLTLRDQDGKAQKAMVELPTGAGKTRVAAETALRLLRDRAIKGTVLWIAQSQELCEQAVQTFNDIWRGLQVREPLTIGRLWDRRQVEKPRTELSVVVATDAKLERMITEDRADEYDWLARAAAVFVDEGHRAGDSQRYTRILAWLGVDGRRWERPLVALSATPFRGRSEEGTRSLVSRFGGRRIQAFAEDDAYQQLVERGVLARIKHEILDGTRISLDASDREEIQGWNRFSSSVLNRVADDQTRMSTLMDHILSLDPTWPVLVFTPTVLSAQGLAARLKIRGVASESISGETGAKERGRIIERFKNGETRVLANCDLLTAGFDAPKVRALYVAKPTLSPNAYIQMVGRGLRGPKNGGKEECLIVDLQDNFDGLSGGTLAYTEFDYLWEERR